MPRVVHFEINAEDMIRAKKFYETVLQVELKPLNKSNPELWSLSSSWPSAPRD